MPPGSNCHQIWGMTCEPWRYITLFLYGCILLANIASTCLFEELSEQKNQTHRPTLAAVLYMSTSQVYFCHCWRFSLIDTISIICIFLHNHQPRTCFDSMILWGGRFLVSYSSNGGVAKSCWRSQKNLRFVYMDKILYYSYDIMDARSRTVGMYI